MTSSHLREQAALDSQQAVPQVSMSGQPNTKQPCGFVCLQLYAKSGGRVQSAAFGQLCEVYVLHRDILPT